MYTLSNLQTSLQTARSHAGLSYEEIAKRAGLSPLAVRHAIQGKAAPKITSLFAIADALGLQLRLVAQNEAAIFDSLHAQPTQAPTPTLIKTALGQS